MPLLQYHLLWPPRNKWHLPVSPAMPLQPRYHLEFLCKTQNMHAGETETHSLTPFAPNRTVLPFQYSS